MVLGRQRIAVESHPAGAAAPGDFQGMGNPLYFHLRLLCKGKNAFPATTSPPWRYVIRALGCACEGRTWGAWGREKGLAAFTALSISSQ